MSTPTIPFYPVTHDDGTSIVSALNNIASARRMPIVVADAFSTLESYNVGDYVIYENNMYRFTSAHSAGTWDSTQVVRVTVGEELKDLSENQNSINSSVSAIDNSLAIISDGDTHIAISSGEYVYVKNHNTLAEGLYTANSSIGANVALTTSNLTSVGNKGGLNKLNTKSIDRVTDFKIVGKLITVPANLSYVSNVSAPSVSGYSFVGWIGTASAGWLGYVYPEYYTASTTNFWVPGNTVASNRDVNIYALYKKTAS